MPGAKHLNALTIRGFRGLEEATFERLGQFNVIVGKNDVGKTSVLEAVFLTAGFTVPLLPIAIQNLRTHVVKDPNDLSLLFHELNAGSPIEFVASTPGDTRQLTISLEPADLFIDQDVGSNHIGSTPEVPLLLRYSAKLVPRHSGKHLAYDGTLSVIDGEVKPMDGTAGPRFRDQSISAEVLIPLPKCDSKVISEVLVRKQQAMLIDGLRAINPQVNSIAVSGGMAYVDTGLDRMIPMSMCGSALARAAHILSLCILGTVRILLIDEIGYGLHHSAMKPLLAAIMAICERQDMQVFFTTHNLEVLECIHKVFQSKTEVYALARDKDNRVRTYRYDYEQFNHAISRRIEIR